MMETAYHTQKSGNTVAAEERSTFLSHGSPAEPGHRRSLSDALPTSTYTVLILGTAILLAVVGFLLYIWTISQQLADGTSGTSLALRIILDGWIARTVTLCAVFIRLATTLQAGVAFSMIGALVWEGNHMRRAHLPHISILRAFSVSAGTVLDLLWDGCFRRLPWLYMLLMCTTLLTGLVLQFSSTILLRDFGDVEVVAGSRTARMNIGMRYGGSVGDVQTYAGINYWKSNPVNFPRFAEHRESSFSRGDDFEDTGHSTRAFLPLAEREDRQRLRNYSGPTTAIDARTFCVRPSLQLDTFQWLEDDSVLVLNGTLDVPREHSQLVHTSENPSGTTQFSCSVVLRNETLIPNDNSSYWPVTLCSLESVLELREPIQDLMEFFTTSKLLLNTTSRGASDWVFTNRVFEPSDDGTWIKYAPEDDGPEIAIHATLCFVNPLPWTYDLQIWSKRDGPEPRIGWDNRTGVYQTDEILSVFGNSSEQSDAVMQFATPADKAKYSNGVDHRIKNFLWTALRYGDDGTLILYPKETDFYGTVHRVYIAIFQHALQRSGPAIALQTLYTLLMQAAYYDFLPQYDYPSDVIMAFSETQNIPASWIGMSVVAAAVLAHLLAVCIICILYFAKTKETKLGNAWQAVGDVAEHRDAVTILPWARRTTDREVRRRLKLQTDDSFELRPRDDGM